jgi:hypothetical protein
VASGTAPQRNKDMAGASEAVRSCTDDSFMHGQGSIQKDDRTRKLTSHCKVSAFI